jgi:hypothetical protein
LARWDYFQHQRANLPSIGKDLDDAMDAIEKENPNLKGVLPKEYARPALDKKRLGELIGLIGNVGFNQKGHSSKDLVCRCRGHVRRWITFDEKVAELTTNLREQFSQSNELRDRIRKNLKRIGLNI